MIAPVTAAADGPTEFYSAAHGVGILQPTSADKNGVALSRTGSERASATEPRLSAGLASETPRLTRRPSREVAVTGPQPPAGRLHRKVSAAGRPARRATDLAASQPAAHRPRAGAAAAGAAAAASVGCCNAPPPTAVRYTDTSSRADTIGSPRPAAATTNTFRAV